MTDYPPELVTQALQAIVVAGGNCAEAHRKLEENGGLVDNDGYNHGLPAARTLRDWKNDTHSQQYETLDRVYSTELEDQLVSLARENAKRGAEATRQLIDQVLEDIKDGRLKGIDAARAAASLAKVTGQNVTDVLRLTDRPVDGRDSDMGDSLQWLLDVGLLKPTRELPQAATDTTADDEAAPELEDATVVA